GDLRRQITCYCEAAPDYKAGRMPQFTVQLRCPSPFWQDESRDEVHVAEWEGLMEFDDANGLQLDADWRIGNRTAELIVEVTNAGDVDCGLTVVFVAEGAVTNPELMNAETLKAIKLNIEMVSGDRIEVTTAYGQKSAILTRSGELYNIFRCIDESTDFLQLEVGANLFVADAGTNASSLNTTILHSDLYLGV
ncbi:MAG: phage tail family protein, partial [Clostridia bacterium]